MAAAAVSLGGLALLQAKEQGEHKHEHHGPKMHHKMIGNPLEHLSKDLELTDAQKAQVQPIIDQAKPQIEAIHKEAMEKTHAVMESTGAQIRPLLTLQQQQKYDAMKKAHEEMRKAKQQLHEAKKM
jgi:hypothetical protein